jgi:molybdopterin synthase sulfur carrier subunit
MAIKVRFHARLQEIIGGAELILDAQTAEKVRDILTLLHERYGEAFDKYVRGQDSEIADYMQVLLDGTNIVNLNGLDTRVKDGSNIDFVPLVAGG